MIKLTRLNQHMVAINPDNILWADASPDTTLCLAGGEKLIVRESLDELIEKIAVYQASLKARATTGAFPRPPSNGQSSQATGPAPTAKGE